MDIWHSPINLARLQSWCNGTAVEHLGIEFTDFGADWLAARMPVDHRTIQPFRLLHGGASVLLAESLGSVARAVGQACGDNPFPIVTPCHRVVSARGIGGFAHHAEGFLIDTKRWLLQHEAAA